MVRVFGREYASVNIKIGNPERLRRNWKILPQNEPWDGYCSDCDSNVHLLFLINSLVVRVMKLEESQPARTEISKSAKN